MSCGNGKMSCGNVYKEVEPTISGFENVTELDSEHEPF